MKIEEPYKKLPKTVEAVMEWDGAMGFTCRSGSGHEIKADASIEHGGVDDGARPMELLLFSLSSCTGMDVVTFLRKRKRHLEDIKISAHGRRVAGHPHVFETITLEYILTGSDLTDNDIRWAVDLSLQKYCSVAGMLGKICKINYHWKILKPGPGG
ncbi:MAG: OsmC family protein [Candidatus Zixiibacteriota bacterium]|nr:MAG: OsmC family protein [candidate division Zixibacteria bacterium]